MRFSLFLVAFIGFVLIAVGKDSDVVLSDGRNSDVVFSDGRNIDVALSDNPVFPADSLRSDVVQQRIAEQVLLFPQEKLYVHTDRSLYVSGEQIWFRAYLLDAVLHVPSLHSNYVHLELIGPADSVVSRVRVKRDGAVFSGTIPLDDRLPEGEYVLRAYTDNLRNLGGDYFFHRPIRLLNPYATVARWDRGNGQTSTHLPTEAHPSAAAHPAAAPEGQLDISFFPEGGQLITDVPCRVAFKALYRDGSPAAVRGRLVDDRGEDHGPVETLHDGMGLIVLTPQEGRRYFVSRDEDRFALPPAHDDLFSLRTELMTGGELGVSVLHSPRLRADGSLFLLLHTRGMVHYAAPWDPRYSGLSFDTADFPSGVLQILLVDGLGRPLSERLVFCRSGDDATVDLSTDQATYEARKPVQATLKLSDPAGRPLQGSFSVSVTDDRDVSPDAGTDILSTILLGSELKGYIHDPAYYLRAEHQTAADLLMLTHGWRRYDIPEALGQQYAQPAVTERQGLEIRGRVTTTGPRPRAVAGSKVTVFCWQTDFMEETLTDEEGRFVFSGLEFPDSLTFVVQAEPPKGRTFLTVQVEQETFPAVAANLTAGRRSATEGAGQAAGETGQTIEQAALERAQQANVVEKASRQISHNGMRPIDIQEVQVDARRSEPTTGSFSYFMPRDRRNVLTSEQLDEIQPLSVSDALKYLPFIRIEADDNDQKKAYIGQMQLNSMDSALKQGLPAVVIVDDMIINEPYDIDNILDPFNIETIGVLKGAGAVMLGGRGAGGAIVITTKKGLTPTRRQDQNQERVRTVSPLGLQEPVEFYSPRYDTAEQQNKQDQDLRTTIYWNPAVQSAPSGEAAIEFFTGDGNSTYTVVVEGVAENGMLIRQIFRITRK